MADAKTEKELHRIFDITLLLKGIHAAIELIGGLLLYIVSADSITRAVDFFVKGDIIAGYLLTVGHSFGGSSKAFAALYLASHGVVNGLVTLGLWKEKIWAYPISFAVIMGFIAYQLYLLGFGYSLWLVILTVLDVAILLLAWHEYHLLKERKAAAL